MYAADLRFTVISKKKSRQILPNQQTAENLA
jgi:hypothetical protein